MSAINIVPFFIPLTACYLINYFFFFAMDGFNFVRSELITPATAPPMTTVLVVIDR